MPVAPHYHVERDGHHYSVPYRLVHEKLDRVFYRYHGGDGAPGARVWRVTPAVASAAGGLPVGGQVPDHDREP